MYVVCVTFKIKDECLDIFMPLMTRNAEASLDKEDQCRQFDVCIDENNPTTVFLYELYDDEAAFKAHLAAPHFKEFDAAVSNMIAEKTVQIFTRI
jgi:autoinducer 2-degrading protein